jgi:hypothetical protein
VFKFLGRVFKNPALAQNPIGNINKPGALSNIASTQGEGLFKLLNNIMKVMIVGAGLFAMFNFITAGYEFISAGGDAQKINNAWNKIWQSMLGVLIAAGSFTIAGLLGKLIFGEWTAIIIPEITGP